jgi:DNA-binding MarR family transcriptional regulator
MRGRGRSRELVTQSEYETLAAFRYALRRFFAFSEAAARTVGLTPRQYQALLVVKGLPAGCRVSVGDLAERLRIRHHSAVGLVDRLSSLRLLAREAAVEDRRRVHLMLTPRGERTLARLAASHREELRRMGPELGALLRQLRPRSPSDDVRA